MTPQQREFLDEVTDRYGAPDYMLESLTYLGVCSPLLMLEWSEPARRLFVTCEGQAVDWRPVE